MKKYILIFLMLIVFAVCGSLLLVSCSPEQNDASDYIRIHVRANSDSPEDQTIKLAVRDTIVQYIAPLAIGVQNKEEMWRLLQTRAAEMEQRANDTLFTGGFPYTCHVAFRQESFPTRTYGDLTLAEGVYDAVIVELGNAKGQNWWCVAYPPLCFVAAKQTGKEEVRYRSWIADMLR